MVSNTASIRKGIIFNYFVPESCVSVLGTAQGSWVTKGARVIKQNQEACYTSFLHLLPVSKHVFLSTYGALWYWLFIKYLGVVTC